MPEALADARPAALLPGLMLSRRKIVTSICAIPIIGRSAFADETWPRQPVRIILGQPAGSGSDPAIRGLAPHLAAEFGQPFIVENVAGNGGISAAAAVAHARDGVTLGVVLGGPTTTAKALNINLSYDPERDFQPVSLLTRTPFVLTVHPGTFSGQRFSDVIDYARAHPGKLSYASIGPGTVTHLAMEEIKSELGLDLVHVPYRGFPQASLDLAAGRIQLMFNVGSAAAEHVAAGRLLAIATTGARRAPLFAEVPTLTELGVPMQPFFGWSGMIAPASFPEVIARRIARTIRQAFATDPASRGGLDRSGSEVIGSDPEELRSLQASEAIRWIRLIDRLGLRPR